jgi:glycine cleavage system regulatory protein
VPETGTPIYTMRIRMAAPPDLDRAALAARLEEVAAALRVELVLRERPQAP